MPSLEELLHDLLGKDESAAESAATALAQYGEDLLPRLSPLLESAQAEERWWAVRTLAAMAHPPMDWLRRALLDPAPEVRAAAALALETHPDQAAATALVHALGDEDSVVAVLAVSALSKIGAAVVPAVMEAFGSSSPRGRIAIMRTLAEIRDPRAIGLMMKALEQDSAALQYWAQEGLERMGLNMVYIKPD